MVGTITYNPANNLITAVGGTSQAPIGFIDLYNADVVGGWGKIVLLGTSQFAFSAKLQVGDGTTATYFADTNKQVWVNEATVTGNSQNFILVTTNATVTLGTLIDAATKRTSSGCVFMSNFSTYYYVTYFSNDSANAVTRLYSCVFSASNTRHARIRGGTTSVTMWNCMITQAVRLTLKVDAYNVQCHTLAGVATNFLDNCIGEFDTITVYNATAAAGLAGDYTGTQNIVFRNVFARGCSKLLVISSTRNWDVYFVDADSDTWAFTWGTDGTGKVYRQGSFDLAVTDAEGTPLEGATVTLFDKDGTEIFSESTDADGKIATQIVTRGFYQRSTGDALTDASPHTLTVNKAGFQKYTKKFALTERSKWEIKLAHAQTILLDCGKPTLNLCPSNPENRHVLSL